MVGGLRNAGAARVRRTLTCLLLLAVVATTAGCSPRKITITAVFLEAGRPVAIFHPCAGDRVSGISLNDSTGVAQGSPAPTDGLAWSVVDLGDHPVEQITLLQTPPGWILQTTRSSVPTEPRPDRTYWVRVDTAGPGTANDNGVQFTLADLQSLADGQVWAQPEAYAKARAMTRAEFDGYAEAGC